MSFLVGAGSFGHAHLSCSALSQGQYASARGTGRADTLAARCICILAAILKQTVTVPMPVCCFNRDRLSGTSLIRSQPHMDTA